MHASGGCHIFWICHKNRTASMRLAGGHARMRVPGRGMAYNCAHFLLLCIHIYTNVNSFLRHIINSWLPFHLLPVYDISTHIFTETFIVCIILLHNPVCILCSYHFNNMYKIFTTHTFTQQNRNYDVRCKYLCNFV